MAINGKHSPNLTGATAIPLFVHRLFLYVCFGMKYNKEDRQLCALIFAVLLTCLMHEINYKENH